MADDREDVIKCGTLCRTLRTLCGLPAAYFTCACRSLRGALLKQHDTAMSQVLIANTERANLKHTEVQFDKDLDTYRKVCSGLLTPEVLSRAALRALRSLAWHAGADRCARAQAHAFFEDQASQLLTELKSECAKNADMTLVWEKKRDEIMGKLSRVDFCNNIVVRARACAFHWAAGAGA